MGLNATDILGSTELAGVKVNPPGLAKAIMARNTVAVGPGGLAGAAVKALADAAIHAKLESAAKKERAAAAESTAPAFRKIAWLALTADEIALVEVDTRTTLKFTGTVLARTPRSHLSSVELIKSKPLVPAPLVLTFADGQKWIFEVPATSRGRAKQLVANLS